MKTALIIGANSDLAKEMIPLLEGEFEVLKASSSIKDNALSFNGQDPSTATELVKNLEKTPDWVFIFSGYLGNHELAINDPKEVLKIIDINFRSIAILIQELSNRMKGKRGKIIAISSVSGDRGRQGNFFYGSAKSALTTLMDGYRHYYTGSNLSFVTVIPGFIKTKMLVEKTPGFLTLPPSKAAKMILKKVKRGRRRFYVGPIWYWVMLVIRNIPEFIFLKTKI